MRPANSLNSESLLGMHSPKCVFAEDLSYYTIIDFRRMEEVGSVSGISLLFADSQLVIIDIHIQIVLSFGKKMSVTLHGEGYAFVSDELA